MKVVEQSVELLSQKDLFQHIELAARTCYKAEDKITADSARKMVGGLINSGHYAMLEHGTVYLSLKIGSPLDDEDWMEKTDVLNRYGRNPYSIVRTISGTYTEVFITTNYRVIIENGWLRDMQYQTTLTDQHIGRYTVRVITNLQVSHELVRHRIGFSYAMESSRYCNYSKDKFGNELTFINPVWFPQIHMDSEELYDIDTWYGAMLAIEKAYFSLLDYGWTVEKAAQVLPKALKTELVITADEYAWNRWFGLRYWEKTGKVHPQMKELSCLLFNTLDGHVRLPEVLRDLRRS